MMLAPFRVRRSQFAVEFTIIFTFVFCVFLLAIGLLVMIIQDKNWDVVQVKVDLMADRITTVIETAAESDYLFNGTICLPADMDGGDYSVHIDPVTKSMILINHTDSRIGVLRHISSLNNTPSQLLKGMSYSVLKRDGLIDIEPCSCICS